MPLPDVLSAISRRTGRFTVWNTPTEHYYEVHVDKGVVTGLLVDNVAVEEVFPLRNRMVELINVSEGEFEFENMASHVLLTQHQLSLDSLLLSGLSFMSELAASRSQFPNAQTVFRAAGPSEPWLTGDLQEFWHSSGPLLVAGASAETIATQTSLFIEHVLLCMYKLRMAGIIVPVRAFQKVWEAGSRSEVVHGILNGGSAGPLLASAAPQGNSGIVRRIMARLWMGITGK